MIYVALDFIPHIPYIPCITSHIHYIIEREHEMKNDIRYLDLQPLEWLSIFMGH